jgi:adenylate cyclase class 2
MIEVERKYHATPAALEALATVTDTTADPVEQTDLYLNAPDRDFAATDEALRLRSTTASGGRPQVVITYKGPRTADAAKARTEYEVGVESLETTAAIFEALGYIEVARVRKQRQRCQWADVDVSIDTLAEGGQFIELELTVANEEDVAAADADLADRAGRLGLSAAELEPRSYLGLVLDMSGSN